MSLRVSARVTASALGLFAACTAHAGVVIFEDNFDAENDGNAALNYNGFAQWTVSDGTVDLIGNGVFDLLPGNGLYLDLDGSSGDAGTLNSVTLSLTPGLYRLEFSLAGNQRGGNSDLVGVSLADWDQTFIMSPSDPLTAYSFDIPISAAVLTSLTFQNEGGDNVGALLDNVRLTLIPSPASGALLGLGGLATRRRRR